MWLGKTVGGLIFIASISYASPATLPAEDARLLLHELITSVSTAETVWLDGEANFQSVVDSKVTRSTEGRLTIAIQQPGKLAVVSDLFMPNRKLLVMDGQAVQHTPPSKFAMLDPGPWPDVDSFLLAGRLRASSLDESLCLLFMRDAYERYFRHAKHLTGSISEIDGRSVRTISFDDWFLRRWELTMEPGPPLVLSKLVVTRTAANRSIRGSAERVGSARLDMLDSKTVAEWHEQQTLVIKVRKLQMNAALPTGAFSPPDVPVEPMPDMFRPSSESVGVSVADLEFFGLDQIRHQLAEFAGQPFVLVSWDLESETGLTSAHAVWEVVRALGIKACFLNGNDSRNELAAFVDKHRQIDWPVHYDPNRKTLAALGASRVHAFVIDANSVVVWEGAVSTATGLSELLLQLDRIQR